MHLWAANASCRCTMLGCLFQVRLHKICTVVLALVQVALFQKLAIWFGSLALGCIYISIYFKLGIRDSFLAQWLQLCWGRVWTQQHCISDALEDSGAVLRLGWSPRKDKRHWRITSGKTIKHDHAVTHATWQPAVAWLFFIQCMHCSFAPHSHHTEISHTTCLDPPWFPGHGASLTKSALVRRLWNMFMPRIGS